MCDDKSKRVAREIMNMTGLIPLDEMGERVRHATEILQREYEGVYSRDWHPGTGSKLDKDAIEAKLNVALEALERIDQGPCGCYVNDRGIVTHVTDGFCSATIASECIKEIGGE